MKLCVRVLRHEKGHYTAVCPSLPGCLARGQTCREAVVLMDEAIRGYLAAVGEFVPGSIEQEVEEVPAAQA